MSEQAKPSPRGRPRRRTPAPRVQITVPDGHPLEPHIQGMSARQRSASVLHWATLYKTTQGQQVAAASPPNVGESPRVFVVDAAFEECLNLGIG